MAASRCSVSCLTCELSSASRAACRASICGHTMGTKLPGRMPYALCPRMPYALECPAPCPPLLPYALLFSYVLTFLPSPICSLPSLFPAVPSFPLPLQTLTRLI